MAFPNPGIALIPVPDGRTLKIAYRRLPDRYIEYRISFPGDPSKIVPRSDPDQVREWRGLHTMKTVDQDQAILDGIAGMANQYPNMLTASNLDIPTIQLEFPNRVQDGGFL